MPIQTLATLADIDAAEWDALLPPAQPFLRHAFLSALEDSRSVTPATGWRPAHRVLRDPQGRLCAALPAYVKAHSYGEYVFDWSWADACQRAGIRYYPKLLVGCLHPGRRCAPAGRGRRVAGAARVPWRGGRGERSVEHPCEFHRRPGGHLACRA